ncbi:hypothetical protein [Streptomyces sp. NPDC048191]|uniref:hypothetical protein n=1 Tax=Streptomyces sp. NPDC048191 TaxID=3155484 RepID=UPI0033E284B8
MTPSRVTAGWAAGPSAGRVVAERARIAPGERTASGVFGHPAFGGDGKVAGGATVIGTDRAAGPAEPVAQAG